MDTRLYTRIPLDIGILHWVLARYMVTLVAMTILQWGINLYTQIQRDTKI